VRVQVKANQPTLSQALTAFIAQAPTGDCQVSVGLGRRNRHEPRTVRGGPFPVERFVSDSPWRLGRTLIEVIRVTDRFPTRSGPWQRQQERRLYLCTRSRTAAQAAHAIRQHWAIENRLH
jgi:hypothetical protein